jgi:hypothetical protein
MQITFLSGVRRFSFRSSSPPKETAVRKVFNGPSFPLNLSSLAKKAMQKDRKGLAAT